MIISIKQMAPYGGVPRAVLRRASITDADVRVYAALSSHLRYSTASWVWPSIATLARETGKPRRTVQRCLRRLAAAGLIVVRERRGQSTMYAFLDPHSASVRSDTGDTGGVTGVAPRGVTGVALTSKLKRTSAEDPSAPAEPLLEWMTIERVCQAYAHLLQRPAPQAWRQAVIAAYRNGHHGAVEIIDAELLQTALRDHDDVSALHVLHLARSERARRSYLSTQRTANRLLSGAMQLHFDSLPMMRQRELLADASKQLPNACNPDLLLKTASSLAWADREG